MNLPTVDEIRKALMEAQNSVAAAQERLTYAINLADLFVLEGLSFDLGGALRSTEDLAVRIHGLILEVGGA